MIIASVLVIVSVVLWSASAPDYIGNFKTDALKEEVHFVSGQHSAVMRIRILFLQVTGPDEIKTLLKSRCPAGQGWAWNDYGDVGSVAKGDTQIVWAPSAVATQGTSDSPSDSGMMVMEYMPLNRFEFVWEEVKRGKSLQIEK